MSASKSNLDKLQQLLVQYRKAYLVNKKYEALDESATRLMVNHFLTSVLGFIQIDEIKTEYAIKGTYADYVIQIDRKKHFIVEVKSIQIDLSEDHLRQSINYAANEGIDWVMLTNGKQFDLYRVIFAKPITHKKIFSFNLSDITQLKDSVELIYLLTKKAFSNKELDHYWARFLALEPVNLAKLLYSEEVIKFLRKSLKKKTDINFSDEDIIDSIYQVIVLKIDSTKPKFKSKKTVVKSKSEIPSSSS